MTAGSLFSNGQKVLINPPRSIKICKVGYTQSMNYRIYVDTEYCYPDMKRTDPRPTSKDKRQIVQVAAILYDAENGQELASFDKLALPLENESITPFFEELTGICKEDIQRKGRYFPEVLQAFVDFCKDHPVWTFHKDQEVFEQNCSYYGIPSPFLENFTRVKPLLKSWGIDPNAYSSGTLYKAAGLEMQGHAHNALHDVRSMAAAVKDLE